LRPRPEKWSLVLALEEVSRVCTDVKSEFINIPIRGMRERKMKKKERREIYMQKEGRKVGHRRT
jgi:hypothetical protein